MGKKYHKERVLHYSEQKKIRYGKLQQLVDDEEYYSINE
jgi:hypothetical protein